MATEFAPNIQDASLNPAVFALPTQVGEANGKTSAAVDLAADTVKPSNVEVELSVPALSDTIAPAASTAGVIYEIQTSNSSTFNGVKRTIGRENFVGAGSGVPLTTLRARLPSDCLRYIRGKVWLGTTATDASAVSATLTLRF